MGVIQNGAYISKFNGDKIDELLEITNWQSNRNLLDNWDFSNADNIVDQRGGKIVPPNTPCWTSADSVPSSGTSGSSPVLAYRQITITGTNSGGVAYVGWAYNNTTYYTRAGYAVRGYYKATSGYAIDKCLLYNGAIIIEDSCLHLVGTQTYSNIRFPLEVARFVPGKTYTVSAIILDSSGVTSGRAYFSTYINGTETNYKNIRQTGLFTTQITMPSSFTTQTVSICFVSSSSSGEDLRIKAIKIEDGPISTLCHNEGTEANPVWVLNEHQDYGEELAKCQRYQQQVNISRNAVIHVGIAQLISATDKKWNVFIPTPVSLRASPAVTSMFVSGSFYINYNGNSYSLSGNPALQTCSSGCVEVLVTTANAVSGAVVGDTGILLATGTPSIILDSNL